MKCDARFTGDCAALLRPVSELGLRKPAAELRSSNWKRTTSKSSTPAEPNTHLQRQFQPDGTL
eukprot:scaffold382632_cov34-Prasinocladus_malaysianus.AAC.2